MSKGMTTTAGATVLDDEAIQAALDWAIANLDGERLQDYLVKVYRPLLAGRAKADASGQGKPSGWRPSRARLAAGSQPGGPRDRERGAFPWGGTLAQFIVDNMYGRPEFRVVEVRGGVKVYDTMTGERVYRDQVLEFKRALEMCGED